MALLSRLSSTWRSRRASATTQARASVARAASTALALRQRRHPAAATSSQRSVQRVPARAPSGSAPASIGWQVEHVVDQRQQVLRRPTRMCATRSALALGQRCGGVVRASAGRSRAPRSAACAARGSCAPGTPTWPGWRCSAACLVAQRLFGARRCGDVPVDADHADAPGPARRAARGRRSPASAASRRASAPGTRIRRARRRAGARAPASGSCPGRSGR